MEQKQPPGAPTPAGSEAQALDRWLKVAGDLDDFLFFEDYGVLPPQEEHA